MLPSTETLEVAKTRQTHQELWAVRDRWIKMTVSSRKLSSTYLKKEPQSLIFFFFCVKCFSFSPIFEGGPIVTGSYILTGYCFLWWSFFCDSKCYWYHDFYWNIWPLVLCTSPWRWRSKTSSHSQMVTASESEGYSQIFISSKVHGLDWIKLKYRDENAKHPKFRVRMWYLKQSN